MVKYAFFLITVQMIYFVYIQSNGQVLLKVNILTSSWKTYIKHDSKSAWSALIKWQSKQILIFNLILQTVHK